MSHTQPLCKQDISDGACYICYESMDYFDINKIVFCLNCKKDFHLVCMETWKKTGISPNKKECPYCFKNTLKYPKNRSFCCLPFFK